MPKQFKTETVQPPGKHNKKYPCIKCKDVQDYLKLPYEYLNPVQSEFLPYLEDDATNIVIAAPTSSGKTLCAELFAVRSIILKKKVLYIAPMKALADEKIFEWTKEGSYMSKYNIEILTGDFVLSDEKKVKLGLADIILMTPEMFNSKCRFYKDHEWLHNSSVICDEAHIIGSVGRGDKIEIGLIQYFENSPESRALFLSATIPNVKDFADWLNHLTKRESIIIQSDYRPCKLNKRFSTFNSGGGFASYEAKEYRRFEKVISEIEKYHKHPILVFVGNKIFGRKIKDMCDTLGIKCEYHNADLDRNERNRIENGFRNLDFSVLVSTTTTAWGVNLPARYVILSHTNFGLTPMDPADAIQAMGRAGRLGYADEGDAIIITEDKEIEKEQKRLFGDYRVQSRLNDVNVLMFHVLSYILNGDIKNSDDLYEWYNKTLASVQKNQLTKQLCKMVLKNLVTRNMIKPSKTDNGNYDITPLGEVTARMYMSPLDVSDWFRNFARLKKLNPKKNDTSKEVEFTNRSIALALAECYTWGKGNINKSAYLSKAEQRSTVVQEFCRALNIVKPAEHPYLKYAAVFYSMLSGQKIENILASIGFGMKNDLERIFTTLKLVDSRYGKYVKKMNDKCNGYNWGKEWDHLYARMRYGVSAELVDLVQVDGIGTVLAKKLFERGISSKNSLFSESNKSVVEKILGPKRYKNIVLNK